jgi:hypothetical protein
MTIAPPEDLGMMIATINTHRRAARVAASELSAATPRVVTLIAQADEYMGAENVKRRAVQMAKSMEHIRQSLLRIDKLLTAMAGTAVKVATDAQEFERRQSQVARGLKV